MKAEARVAVDWLFMPKYQSLGVLSETIENRNGWKRIPACCGTQKQKPHGPPIKYV
jgi:hypothetical protein